MKITMPYAITAADTESRIIAGRIVSWNAEGSTSAGRTMFKSDSITMAKNIKLVLQQNLRSQRPQPVTMLSRKLQLAFAQISALA